MTVAAIFKKDWLGLLIVVLDRFASDGDFAGLRKLHGIADKVEQNITQDIGWSDNKPIAHRLGLWMEIQPLILDPNSHDVSDFGQQFGWPER